MSNTYTNIGEVQDKFDGTFLKDADIGITVQAYSVTNALLTDVRSGNRIYNGNFGINQRGVSGTVVLTAGVYGHDRFKAGAGGCTYTFATVANVTTITISAGTLIQVVEGINLSSGTHTLSWVGTSQATIDGGALSDTGVTGTATGGTNMTVEFDAGTLASVRLDLGSYRLSGDREYGEELALCQRYAFQISGNLKSFGSGQCFGTTGAFVVYQLPVPMRAVPTMVVSSASHFVISSSAGGNVACTALTLLSISSEHSIAIEVTVSSGLTAGNATIGFSNNTSASLLLTAEL